MDERDKLKILNCNKTQFPQIHMSFIQKYYRLKNKFNKKCDKRSLTLHVQLLWLIGPAMYVGDKDVVVVEYFDATVRQDDLLNQFVGLFAPILFFNAKSGLHLVFIIIQFNLRHTPWFARKSGRMRSEQIFLVGKTDFVYLMQK